MRERERPCLEAEEAPLVRARIRTKVRFCRKAHLEQRDGVWYRLKDTSKRREIEPPKQSGVL